MQYWVHHLNDTSGSPLILAENLKKAAPEAEITLITNRGQGFLSEWQGRTITIPYTKHSNRALRFFSLSSWYLMTFFYLIINARRGDSLVLSTLISSPLIGARFFKSFSTIQISINEVFFRVPIWRSIGLWLAKSKHVKKVYLSNYVKNKWDFEGDFQITYPRLRQSIIELSEKAERRVPINTDAMAFFLVGSYIEAKGYKLFLEVARHFEDLDSKHTFSLYLSGSEKQFYAEFPNSSLPKNLSVTFNNSSASIFVGHDVFLGLTNPELWIETFGQTFAEAMMMGNIAILPNVGAQLEYAKDGCNAFLFDEYSLDGVLVQINRVIQERDIDRMARNSRQSMIDFYEQNT